MVAPATGLPPFRLAGRSAELAALRISLERAAQGQGGITFLSGPSGVDKSRLAQAIREEGERRSYGPGRGIDPDGPRAESTEDPASASRSFRAPAPESGRSWMCCPSHSQPSPST
ncbi:MAG: ATP-binding protein [Gemmatimonadetes bacterium]|nr:ATP-binding protein [Gemmatimonadota bacterium]